MPSINGTKEQFADYLIDGFWDDFGGRSRQWSDTNVTYSLSSSFTASQQAGFRMAFQQWADVADITFSEVGNGGDINVVRGHDGRAYSSSSYYLSTGNIVENTISMDTSPWYWTNIGEVGDYALTTAIHEIGHSIGLGHPGNYNGAGTSYANDAHFINDTRQYSLMSYFDADETGAYHWSEYASTPLVMDIYAIQQIYGANMSTRTGDTTYGFNSTAGRDQFDFSTHNRPVVAIWDAGGTDTLDLSGYSNTQVIDLRAGNFSNVGGGRGNVAIAYGATVENAVGGSGVDTIYTNDAANNIRAGHGNDIIYGSIGSDTYNGQAGSDTVNYTGFNIGDFVVSLVDAVTVTLQHIAQGFTDTLQNIETFIFNGQSFDYNGLSAFDTSVQDLQKATFRWDGGGQMRVRSTTVQDRNFTAEQANYNGLSGDIIRMDRGVGTMDIHVLNAAVAGDISIGGTAGDDVTNLYGTTANQDARLYGADGDDELRIHGTGNGRLHGGDGNDDLYGDEGNDLLFGDIITGSENMSGLIDCMVGRAMIACLVIAAMMSFMAGRAMIFCMAKMAMTH